MKHIIPCLSLLLSSIAIVLILPHRDVLAQKIAPTPSSGVLPAVHASWVDFSPGAQVLRVVGRLYATQGIWPQWPGPVFKVGQPLTARETAAAIPYLMTCESGGKSVKTLDSNGKYSYGPLQIQSSTWANFEALCHDTGDPMIMNDAVRIASCAIEKGQLSQWSCAKHVGILP